MNQEEIHTYSGRICVGERDGLPNALLACVYVNGKLVGDPVHYEVTEAVEAIAAFARRSGS